MAGEFAAKDLEHLFLAQICVSTQSMGPSAHSRVCCGATCTSHNHLLSRSLYAGNGAGLAVEERALSR